MRDRLMRIRLMITDSEMQCSWPTDEGECDDIDRCLFCSLLREIDEAVSFLREIDKALLEAAS